jgi:hypothetical protein
MSVNSFFVKPTLPAPIMAILKLMILTFRSIEQAAAGKTTAFSSHGHNGCETRSKSWGFLRPPILFGG